LSEEPTVEPEETVPDQAPVLVLPARFFFVDAFDLPEALEDGELDDFAELSLEGVAPFPLDQLYWGFLRNESGRQILVYAALKDRLKRLGYTDLESYTWALPDFATLAGAHFPTDQTIALETESGKTRLAWPADQPLPSAVEPAEEGEEGDPTSDTSLTLQLGPVTLSEQGIPTFRFTSDSSEVPGHWQEIRLNEHQLWRADVRDTSFKKAERNNRRLTGQITRFTGYAIIFALILALFELILIGGEFWLQTRTETIESQSSAVRRVEDKQSLMNKLDQVAQNELRPIAILEALNRARPEGIYFTSTVAEDQNRITIDGIANTINELNAYTDALKDSGAFTLVGDPQYLTRSGQTTFSVTLDYNHAAATAAARPIGETEE
jgi:Tfp pilus assembly protein PilN